METQMKPVFRLACGWRPRTTRELLQVVFSLSVWSEGAVGIVSLYQGNLPRALLYMVGAYLTTAVFGVVYGWCATHIPGTVDADSFTGRQARTGRDCLKRLGLFCALLPLVWAGSFATTLDPVRFGVPLIVLFLTVVGLGQAMRFFCACVTLPQDEGHK
jgi:hypothetical protein